MEPDDNYENYKAKDDQDPFNDNHDSDNRNTRDPNHPAQSQPAAPATSAAHAAPAATSGATAVYTSPRANKALNNQLTAGLIILIVVLLFLMLMLSINGKIFRSGGNNDNNGDHNLVSLEAQNAQLRADANAERARQGLPPIPEGANSARMTASRIQRDATSLASFANQWQKELETKDATIRSLQSQLTSRDENSKLLYAQIASLQNQLDQSATAANQLITLNNDLKMANNQIDNYRAQLGEFHGRPTNEQFAQLRKQLNDSLDKSSKLEMQVDGLLQAAKNKTDTNLYEETLAEVNKLRETNNAQRYEIQSLRAELDRTRLFIESEKDLPAEAARLFARLRTLEKTNKQQLEAAYENIGQTLNAEIAHRQTFASGSSQITFDREKIIQDILDKRKGSKSFFLVVGYASKSGGAENNRKLSAKRATTVASVVNQLKASDQQVKAVYMGETARFSPVAEIENQICEVWEIKR